MTDEEYARIVEELKASKRGERGQDVGALQEAQYRLQRLNAYDAAHLIGSIALHANGFRREGPFASAVIRARGLAQRIHTLTPWKVDADLQDVAVSQCKKLNGLTEPRPEDFDYGLAQIQAAVELAESHREAWRP